MIVDEDISKPEFIAYYVKGDRILAASGCKRKIGVTISRMMAFTLALAINRDQNLDD